MVVDDNAPLGEVIKICLVQFGIASVEWFVSAADALAACGAGTANVDLLLTDRDMPGIGGLELARRIYANVPALKVILMSANHDALSRDALNCAGIFGTLSKPFSVPRLEAMVRAATCELAFRPVIQRDPFRCTCAA